jgi:hypothetical protein
VRRILLLVTVAAVMAALVVVASPAFAARSATGEENRAMPRETGGTPRTAPGLEESAPATSPPGYFKRSASVDEDPKGNRPSTGHKSA